MTEDIVVNVTEGKLRGKISRTSNNKEYYGFYGVPYAKPPIGDLRFKSPQPPEPWEGIQNAIEYTKCAPQKDFSNHGFIGDEDCLYLNVCTPSLPSNESKPLPVMFFIHGGGFAMGSATQPEGDFLIEKGVVFVSIHYRLGILGFLNLDMKEAQGNMGIKDQVEALKWVQRNISKFGGDANNVTIYGISAGGASVEYLMISKMARGLFHKAIAQCGSTLNPWASNRHNNLLLKILAERLGVNHSDHKTLYDHLMKLKTEDLIEAAVYVASNKPTKCGGGLFFGFTPTIEKEFEGREAFIADNTYKLLKQGEFQRIPYISGINSREGLAMYMLNKDKEIEDVSREQTYRDYLPFNLSDSEKQAYEERLKSVYIGSEDYDDSKAIDFFSDMDFLSGAWLASKHISKHNQTYFYEFAYEGAYNVTKALGTNLGKMRGAGHGDDGAYVNYMPLYIPKNGSRDDDLMRERMVQMWTNFAKFGNPTPEKSDLLPFIWEPNTEKSRKYLVMDKEMTVKEDLAPKRIELFEELYEKFWNWDY